MRTRIKICGLTREADIDAAVKAGVDALGFVMWPGSKRALTPERLEQLSARVPPFVTRVGLFVDQAPDLIAECAPWLDMLQFHGEEPPEACELYGMSWLKALRMRDDIDLHEQASRYHRARGLLLDAYRPGVPGGTGEVFDWSRVPADLALPVILAGGLSPENIVQAVHQVTPYGVDVSGGVEASAGVKDHDLIQAFIGGVQTADVTPATR
ncbi:phosphoribosylanthranilate isomerase [Kushneria marisflavi]|uniref:N-(5'-phosphoribosyl)anthranilate isomerase n=1 Tax=Kushneria marisflavi TaxID=157779 RepID=A0A240ULN5_9GAMM|nr:phosphoribosylanthranilate isomerase [Kushneria marisflavi]ART61930.1 N-(5'-phosphoribosyl)anthranilate isomerase [Kushneria marisflavi]RKD86977.1 phosphoribosylanthranilate isomerase [Kushneria marisflavi]